ncbi:MAG: hypothetical protein KJ927_14655, partial [Candidatus Eisenbacteria bacterium]|nr:hypothetical protein [Candidatus Eisenbacteria bacterium]
MKARKRSGDPTKLLLILALAISLLTPWTDLPASSPVSGICFDPAWGKIEGVVTAAGKPFPAIVRVKSIRSSPVKIEIEALTDSLGHYTIIVPHGSYCIDVTGRS